MAYLGEGTPKLGFGLMRLPQLEDKTSDVEHVIKMVDAFMDAGLMYFDTARAYGDSEETIRKALVERYPRNSYILATKNASWIKAKTAEESKACLDTSLETTGVDYFDYYMLHNVGQSRTKVFDDFGMWDFLDEVKQSGKAKHVGISFHDTAPALEKVLSEHPNIEFVQLQINYADWFGGAVQSKAVYETALNHGKSVIVMEPLKGGTLADPPKQVAEILAQANPDMSPVEWALRFAFGLDGVISVLSGMSNIQQMQQNIQIYQNFEPLSDFEMAVMSKAQKALRESLAVPCTACNYCMKQCPMKINIAGVMESLNRAKLYDLEMGKRSYGFETMNGGKASQCVRCGQCELACPQRIRVVEKLGMAVEMFESEPAASAG